MPNEINHNKSRKGGGRRGENQVFCKKKNQTVIIIIIKKKRKENAGKLSHETELHVVKIVNLRPL